MLFVVAVALYGADGKVLVQQRPEGKPMAGLWEFPGGKVAAGETPEHALIRELHEELAINVRIDDLSPLSFATHPLDAVTHQPEQESSHPPLSSERMLLLLLYACRNWSGELQPQEGQMCEWVNAARLRTLPMPPADIPLLNMIFS